MTPEEIWKKFTYRQLIGNYYRYVQNLIEERTWEAGIAGAEIKNKPGEVPDPFAPEETEITVDMRNVPPEQWGKRRIEAISLFG